VYTVKYKLIYLVIDGVADSLRDSPTTLEVSVKPGLDWVASRGVCGLLYPVERGVAPESDEAVISILGYNPHEVYPGRGVLEAIGAGLDLKWGFEVAFRANFATVDPVTRRIIDRRAGRGLSTEEARVLARAIDNMDLGEFDGYARVVATIGHRAVVIIGSRSYKLSPLVSNNDPAYARRGLVSVAVDNPKPYVEEIKPLVSTREAEITARLANLFFEKAMRALTEHQLNAERSRRGLLPANALLLRDAGGEQPRAEPLPVKYHCKFAVLAEMPVEVGIGRALGAYTLKLRPPTGDPRVDYDDRLKETLRTLKDHDVVYVHLKGPDEPGHDGNSELKRIKVEEIDKYYVKPLIEEIRDKYALLVTADHATPPSKRAHTDDPVPVALYTPEIKPDGVTRFTERECAKGALGVVEHGWLLLPRVIREYL
jgi:2,3-bisphosphoglycerate-independent phosphoglycerate mutase